MHKGAVQVALRGDANEAQDISSVVLQFTVFVVQASRFFVSIAGIHGLNYGFHSTSSLSFGNNHIVKNIGIKRQLHRKGYKITQGLIHRTRPKQADVTTSSKL